MSRFFSCVLVCSLGFSLPLLAQTSNGQNTAPDNTRVNQRDQNPNHPTAGQQKENRPDLEITRDIRRSITSDKGLSSSARNVKIITQNGNVTLRGPVGSEQEKRTVEAKANEVAGSGHVKSELEVTTKKKSKKSQ